MPESKVQGNMATEFEFLNSNPVEGWDRYKLTAAYCCIKEHLHEHFWDFLGAFKVPPVKSYKPGMLNIHRACIKPIITVSIFFLNPISLNPKP